MRTIWVRKLSQEEVDKLYNLLEEEVFGKRAKVILLSYQGYAPIEIEKMANMHVKTVRKWIKRFNREGIEGITKKRDSTNNIKIDEETTAKIVEIAKKTPRDFGIPMSTWSLRTLKYYLISEGVVRTISHEKIRTILVENKQKWRKSQDCLVSNDPEYDLKKTSFGFS